MNLFVQTVREAAAEAEATEAARAASAEADTEAAREDSAAATDAAAAGAGSAAAREASVAADTAEARAASAAVSSRLRIHILLVILRCICCTKLLHVMRLIWEILKNSKKKRRNGGLGAHACRASLYASTRTSRHIILYTCEDGTIIGELRVDIGAIINRP